MHIPILAVKDFQGLDVERNFNIERGDLTELPTFGVKLWLPLPGLLIMLSTTVCSTVNFLERFHPPARALQRVVHGRRESFRSAPTPVLITGSIFYLEPLLHASHTGVVRLRGMLTVHARILCCIYVANKIPSRHHSTCSRKSKLVKRVKGRTGSYTNCIATSNAQ